MFRIIRTRVLRHLDAQIIELHDRAEHYRARTENAEAALRAVEAPNPPMKGLTPPEA